MSRFRKLNGGSKYRSWNKWSEGEFISGTWESTSTDKFNKTNYKVSVTESNIEGIEEGDTFTFNSCGGLDHALSSFEPEQQELLVEYMGKGIQEKGPYAGKEFHNVEVSMADAGDVASTDEDEDDL